MQPHENLPQTELDNVPEPSSDGQHDKTRCSTEGHQDHPTVVILVYVGADDDAVSIALCKDCARCTSPGCKKTGDTFDAEYEEPWCQEHAAEFGSEEKPTGPDMVPVDADRSADALHD